MSDTTTTTTATSMDYPVDILAQQPLLKLYTQISLCYPLPGASSHPAIIDTLAKGLQRLAISFPWVAGQIVNEGASEGDTGVYKIQPLDKVPSLVIKDLQNDPSAPTMDALRQAHFPASMLDESVVAPRKTVPLPSEPFDSDPVFLVQATFIPGGLLLTFVGHHMAMDMTGQGHLIRLFSKACRNEPFTNEELSYGNLARDKIIPLLDDSYQPGPELLRQIQKSPPSHEAVEQQAPPPQSTWAYVTFSPASLAELKSLATKTLTSGFVSTDDVLSAFVWQAITRARLPRLDPGAESTFGRAVNVRSYLGVPETYPGLFQDMTFSTRTLQQLVNEPLGSIASQLRSSLDPKTLVYHVRALATIFSRTPDKSVFSFGASIDMARDMMLSSWAKVDCYELDFNLGLGKPECVRRPQLMPFEGLMYLMPRSLEGEIALLVCLRDEDMERLKMDEEFAKYGKYIG
ncbi:putative trichothecene 3-O-acetyltransferase [Aspergillus clavatus NRRL 1]|uniref:Trichothecene 3-O-acetyltransferase, putative n=1 Tax=Aspergillus clavatus (strain ATCC 1007 / CBS 513.65 / DSM 816 / NCTC 3887 / NRRL 1 / QM 1276 / 107) TaxID=344612 RepID=A1CPT8_ASPCL|nr:trichothecene 3-O-acetyltransferase, putative [Aspergillus clavatus NRRL 1]EAW07659.1 trichothecene 3-O-acetyltransferase, putative [Aspergillus clavatus NRRL 1]